MAQLICTTCGTPSDDGYCRICLTDIPLPQEEEEEEVQAADSQGRSEAAIGQEPSAMDASATDGQGGSTCNCESQHVRCLSCGMPGQSGRECPQCGAMLPVADYGQSVLSPMPVSACLILPGGTRLTLEDGQEYLLGRESGIPEIAQALANSQFVSRRHCTIRLDFSSRLVVVRDENSMNGTFVGQVRQKVCGQESFPLPTTVWLGTYVPLTINI